MFTFSFGWVLIAVVFMVAVFLLLRNDEECVFLGIILIMGSVFTSVASYYDANVRYPNKLYAVEEKISKTKAMLGDNTLEGVALKQSIASLISEREDVMLAIRNRDMSPFTLFSTRIKTK